MYADLPKDSGRWLRMKNLLGYVCCIVMRWSRLASSLILAAGEKYAYSHPNRSLRIQSLVCNPLETLWLILKSTVAQLTYPSKWTEPITDD